MFSCLLLSASTSKAGQYGDFTYSTVGTNVTIIGYTGNGGAIIIPDTINGLPVTTIGSEAFFVCEWCVNITSITMGNNITSIGFAAFYNCASLTNLTIGTSVTTIGNEAFDSCTSLTSVTIPSSVTSLGSWAFSKCSSLTSMTIPNSVTNIGSLAFAYCRSLTNVTIGINTTNIGSEAFDYCTSLTAITVNQPNPAYSSSNGVLFDHNQTKLIQYPGGISGCYTIPNSVTNIGSSAFFSCIGLTNVTIPDGITGIEDFAFYYCTSLTNVTIPNSVTSMGNHAFSDCTSLASVTIGNNVPSIGREAFEYCSSLTNVTIGYSVTNIGDHAFTGASLIDVYFQGNAPSLGLEVFPYNNNTTIYYIPGMMGWGPPGTLFGNRPTALWFLPNPLILTRSPNFGMQTNNFGFIISWATNIPVVAEACTSLINPIWSPLQTNTLIDGSCYFSDPQWTNYPARFYRLRSP